MTKSKPVNIIFRLEAAAWYAFAGGIGALPIGGAAQLGAAVVPTIGAFTSAHKTALRNIRMSFPNENDAWRQKVRKDMWREIGRMAGEFPHMGEFVKKLD